MFKFSLMFCLAFVFAMMTSCSKDGEDCHECHIAYMNSVQVEVEVEIGEYCDDDLANVEANGYNLPNDVIVGNDTIPAGFYPGSEIHCDPHLDH